MSIQCMICFETFNENQVFRLCNDKHNFCKECLYLYINYNKKYENNSNDNDNNNDILSDYFDNYYEPYSKSILELNNIIQCPCCKNINNVNVIEDEVNIIDGKKEGNAKIYYNNNKDINVICNYVNNKLEGSYKKFYNFSKEDNNIYKLERVLVFECNFINGQIEGLCKDYYNDGTKKSEYNYINGKLEGPQIVYNNFNNNFNYNKLNNIVPSYVRCNYINGEKEGMYVREKGNFILNCNYINGKKNGLCKILHKKGISKLECYYTNDKLNGRLQYWLKIFFIYILMYEHTYNDGILIKEEVYLPEDFETRYLFLYELFYENKRFSSSGLFQFIDKGIIDFLKYIDINNADKIVNNIIDIIDNNRIINGTDYLILLTKVILKTLHFVIFVQYILIHMMIFIVVLNNFINVVDNKINENNNTYISKIFIFIGCIVVRFILENKYNLIWNNLIKFY